MLHYPLTWCLMIGMNELETAIKAAGGVSVIAGKLNISPQRLTNWIERGVPVEQCAALEIALDGLVTRQQMNPDWARIWPELRTVEAA